MMNVKYLLGEIVFRFLTGLTGQSCQELVEITGCVYLLCFEKMLSQQDLSLLSPLLIGQTAQTFKLN